MAFVGRERWSRRTSFWLVVAAQVLLFVGSNFPTPLFPIYEDRYGFGPGTVTLLFGVYVLVLLPTLVLLGPVADPSAAVRCSWPGSPPRSSAPSPSRWPEGWPGCSRARSSTGSGREW